MGEGEKEQGHTSKLGGGGRTKPQTCGDPWGRRAGGSFRDELGPRSLPSAPPAQPRGSRNQRRTSFLAVLLVSVLVLLASRAPRQLCQGASFPVTPRGRPLVPLAARGSETELRFALSVCILVSWGLGMCLQASSYLSVTGTVTGA